MRARSTGILAGDISKSGAKGFEFDGEKYFAIKKYDKLYVYKNSCPHIGVSLEWVPDDFLDASGTMIQCANHGALFVIENGECVAGPCSGQKLTSVKFTIIDNFICLG